MPLHLSVNHPESEQSLEMAVGQVAGSPRLGGSYGGASLSPSCVGMSLWLSTGAEGDADLTPWS